MGHLFVVHGKIGELSCDAALIPTDADFVIEDHWSVVLGTDVPVPIGWSESSVTLREGVVFADVASRQEPAWLGNQVERAIALVTDNAPSPSRGRSVSLLAMPMVGIGFGGWGTRIGDAIRAVLDAAERAAEGEIDVAIVIPDAAVYAAVQSARRTMPHAALHIEEAERLGNLARDGGLALVFGAGVSMGSGLPSWADLLAEVSVGLELPTGFEQLDDLDKAELLQLLIAQSDGASLGDRIVDALSVEAAPSIAHALLASIGARENVTTNYDKLFERALAAAGEDHQVVLPTEVPHRTAPWLLKLHGDSSAPQTLVLTRGSFVGFDARSRPAGAVLQSLLMTRHVLFVGVSMNDSNLLRLVHEVTAFVERSGGTREQFGTLLNVAPSNAKRSLWERDLHWLELHQPEEHTGGRLAAIFLDAVAMHASKDTSWLLDPRFGGLLDEDTRADAEALRRLAASARERGPAWQPVAQMLRSLGA